MQPGVTYKMLAEKFGVSKSLIPQILTKPRIKALIDKAHQNLAAFTPLAVERFYEMLDDREHSDHYKAVRDQLQTMGILASHTGGNTYIQTVYAASAATQADVKRLTDLLSHRIDTDIQDAEYTDEMSSLSED